MTTNKATTRIKSMAVGILLLILMFGLIGISLAGSDTQVGYGIDTTTTVDIAIYTKDNKPIANAIVVINSPGAFETTYRTGKEGFFTAMVPCRTDQSKSITHEVVVTHDKYKPATDTFTTEEGSCDKEQKVVIHLEPK